MAHYKKLGLLGAALALSACGGSSGGSSGGGPAVPTNLSEYPPGTVMTLTSRQGLEAATITNGTSVTLGALPVLSVQPAPTGSIVLNGATGFAFNMPDGNRVNYNTTAGSTQVIGPQQFKNTVDGASGINVVTTLTSQQNPTLSYSTYGIWEEFNNVNTPLGIGTLAAGIEATGRPTSGTGAYTGNVSGFVTTKTNSVKITGGAVTLNADFAGNTIAGTITGITVSSTQFSSKRLNDITLSTGTITGNNFTGTATAAAAVPGTTFVDIAGAAGTFGGKFYGPSAAEAAGSIFMTGGTNTATVMAAFGAKK